MQWITEALTTALSSANTSDGSPLISVEAPQEATTFAIIYGIPLASYCHLAKKISDKKGEFVTNAFFHQKELASASFNDINRPNVDTLYSEALVDLSVNDLIVTIPEFPSDRFYVFPIYDVYGNNVVNLGTVVGSTPGQYLVSYRPTKPGYSPGDENDEYTGYIYLPTPYGAIDLRIEVNVSDGVKDVLKVNALQVQFTLETGPTHIPLAPSLTESYLFDGLSGSDTEQLLQLTANLSQYNLPEVGSEIARVASILHLAGMSGGSYTTPEGVDLHRSLAAAVASMISLLKVPALFEKYFLDLGGNWAQWRDIYAGDFKEHYTVRALVAAQGYLQLKADQAIYPLYMASKTLTSDKSYTVTFSKKPPVTGFWSLTVYDEKAYLVENQWNIYALGDRSDIKYLDGEPVYGSDHSDVEFTILLQTLDTSPPDKYLSNWIPTPASGEPFQFNLRWYGPTEDLLIYEYPTVSEVSVVQ